MNKIGKTNPMVFVIVGIVVVFILMNAGVFNNGAVISDDEGDASPSDKQSTVELSFKDELSTSETTVNAVWYAFNGDGTFFKSGTATSGTDSFTGNSKSHYDIYAYTTGESGYIAKKSGVDTGTQARVPKTITLIKRGGLTVSATDDPIDLNQNISGTAGATEEFRIKWKVNVSNAGSLAPVVVIESNTSGTGVQDIVMTKTDTAGGKYSEITCPSRINPTSTLKRLYCFKRDKMALASDGTIISYVSMEFGSTNAPGNGDGVTVYLIDTGLYLKPGYTTINELVFSQEDDADSDVGAGDSASKTTYFNN